MPRDDPRTGSGELADAEADVSLSTVHGVGDISTGETGAARGRQRTGVCPTCTFMNSCEYSIFTGFCRVIGSRPFRVVTISGRMGTLAASTAGGLPPAHWGCSTRTQLRH